MRQEHDGVRRKRDYCRREIESEIERQKARRHERFHLAPPQSCYPVQHSASGNNISGIKGTEQPSPVPTNEEVIKRAQRRLVIPKIAIRNLPVQKVDCGGKVVVFICP